MTREEALVQLRIGPGINEDVSEEYNEAVNMAIEALKTQPSERTEERTETHGVCLDAIDRQAVIDTVRKIILGFFSDEDGVMNDTEKTLLSVNKAVCNGVRELPSAQPEPLSDAYTKAVWTWLLNYQIKAAELQGRYTPYEVLSWVANDWRKEHE